MPSLLLILLSALAATASAISPDVDASAPDEPLPPALPTHSETVDGIDWSYIIENGEATITDAFEYPELLALDIPTTVGGGIPVTAIGRHAFSGRGDIQSVAMPDSVRTIGQGAFRFCNNLTDITIGRGVVKIGECVGDHPDDWDWEESVFGGCGDLVDFKVADGNPLLEEIGGCLFYRDTPDTAKTLALYPPGRDTIRFPDGVTVATIGDGAFIGCDKLAEIGIPPSVRDIGTAAFGNCERLRKVVVPDGVTNIARGAFALNTDLMDVEIAGTVKRIGAEAFILDFIGNGNTNGTLVLHEGIGEIGPMAFCYCKYLDEIVIPDSVVRLGPEAFAATHHTRRVVIGDGLENIPSNAFESCMATDITIGRNVKSIGEAAFFCADLVSLELPEGLTDIGERAFACCSKLESVAFPDTLRTIGAGAFSHCPALETLVVPLSVETLGRNPMNGSYSGPFSHMDNLKRIYLPATLKPATEEATKACLADLFGNLAPERLDATKGATILTWYSDKRELAGESAMFDGGSISTADAPPLSQSGSSSNSATANPSSPHSAM